jgi:hypothetical protein
VGVVVKAAIGSNRQQSAATFLLILEIKVAAAAST